MTNTTDVTIWHGMEIVPAEEVFQDAGVPIQNTALTEDEKRHLSETGEMFLIIKADETVSETYDDNVYMTFTIHGQQIGRRVLFMGKNPANAGLYDRIYSLCASGKASGPYWLNYIPEGSNKQGEKYNGFYRLEAAIAVPKSATEQEQFPF